jgi:hypothetical protein
VAAGGYSKLRISPSYALKSINAWAGVFQKATYPHGIHGHQDGSQERGFAFDWPALDPRRLKFDFEFQSSSLVSWKDTTPCLRCSIHGPDGLEPAGASRPVPGIRLEHTSDHLMTHGLRPVHDPW